MNNNLNANSEVWDLLINVDFLRLVKTFINIYCIDEILIDEKVIDFFDNLNAFQYKKDDVKEKFSKSELLDNLWFIFSHEEILSNFIEHIKYSDIDKGLLNVYLEIWDYLIKIYDNKDMYPDNIDIEAIRLKDKVWDILWKWELENISLLIAKNDFPTIWKKWFPIVRIDFDNVVDFYWDADKKFIFLKVEDSEGNIFYHNYKWDIFLTNDWREIVNVEYIYSFNKYSVLKVKTNDLQSSIEIISKDWNIFDMPDIEDALPWKLVDWENELEYIILSKLIEWITKTTLFNNESDTVNLMDILKFINKWQDSKIKLLEKSLSKFEDINLSSIKWIKEIEWIKFVELSIDIENGDENDFVQETNFDIIMMDNWVPLTDDRWEYIKHLFEIESFLWKELLWFGFTPFSIDWFIDSNWTTFTINDKLVHTITWFEAKSITDSRGTFKPRFTASNWNTFSKINDNENFIIKDGKIKNILNNLLWFNEEETEEQNWFDLFFKEKRFLRFIK